MTMEFKEALKKVQSLKAKDNLIIVDNSWGNKLVFNYEDGLAFISALQKAELMEDPYDKDKRKRITGLNRDIKFSLMSRTEYEQIKISMLMNVSLEDVKLHQLELEPV